jgi:predicted GNAT family N-acyltransferase
MIDDFTIKLGSWDEVRDVAAPIRFTVFVSEQKVPEEIELDAMDPVSVHALAYDARGTAVGTGRLLPDGHIGRMAVLPAYRGSGVGTALLQALMDEARSRGMLTVELHSQTQAAPFYRRMGFAEVSEEFYEAGIAHVTMRKDV